MEHEGGRHIRNFRCLPGACPDWCACTVCGPGESYCVFEDTVATHDNTNRCTSTIEAAEKETVQVCPTTLYFQQPTCHAGYAYLSTVLHSLHKSRRAHNTGAYLPTALACLPT